MQLAIALARRFDGEIINCDALQLYRGLPIATNKVPPDAMHGVPHHLLECIGPEEPTWTVGKFSSAAEAAIRDIRSRGRLPIVVGGTHYYLQSLLFSGTTVAGGSATYLSTREMEAKWPILREGNEAMLDELDRVDPAMARRWHPNDTRKIRRSLEIWLQTGKKPSEIYADQELAALEHSGPAKDGARKLSVPGCLRHDSLIFWLHCDQSVLETRLRQRVESMVEHGLLDEVSELRGLIDRSTHETQIDTTKGIWAAIGYKEFEGYLEGLRSKVNDEELEKRRSDAVERVKIATRQYAKRQTRWIRRKLLPMLRDTHSDKLFVLDCSQPARRLQEVEENAHRVVDMYLAGGYLLKPIDISETARTVLTANADSPPTQRPKARACQLCKTTTTTQTDWANHVNSKRHRALLRKNREALANGDRTEDGEKT